MHIHIQYNTMGRSRTQELEGSRCSSESTRDTGIINRRITRKHNDSEKLREKVKDYCYSTRLPLANVTHLEVIFAL